MPFTSLRGGLYLSLGQPNALAASAISAQFGQDTLDANRLRRADQPALRAEVDRICMPM